MSLNPIVGLPVSAYVQPNTPATPAQTAAQVAAAAAQAGELADSAAASSAPTDITTLTTAAAQIAAAQTGATTSASALAAPVSTAPLTAAQLATAVAAATAVDATGDIASITVNPSAFPASLVLEAVAAQSATSQDSLAPLLADLTAALESTALPSAARTAVTQLLAAQSPLNVSTTAASLQNAVAGSGLFLEANLAAAAENDEQALDTSNDMKALLLQLTNTLDPATLDPAATDPLAAALVGSTLQPRPQARLAQRLPPRPVIAGAVTAGTPVAKVSIGPDSSRDVLTSSLRQEAAAALSRLTMSQLASVPKSGQTTRWTFELPVETEGGLGMAQFEISRDAHSAGGAQAEPTWRARFSMDVEPSGPVHAEVSLSGGRTRATLWAERDHAHEALDAEQADLTSALADGGDAAVRIMPGAPADTSPQVAGRYVDRTS